MKRLHLASVVIAAALFCGSAQAGGVSITKGWFRVLPGSVPAGGYFTLVNGTDRPIVLTGASSPACGSIMLHKSAGMGGMEHMDMVDSLEVPSHGQILFAPGGYHLMCVKPVHARLRTGGTVPVTLDLADGAHLITRFEVRNARGR